MLMIGDRARNVADPYGLGNGAGQVFDSFAAECKPMIGFGAGTTDRSLRHIQPIHTGVLSIVHGRAYTPPAHEVGRVA